MENYQKKDKVILTDSEELEIIWQGDVIIMGGGMSGAMAACASVRKWAKTVVIEKNGFLGGVAAASPGICLSDVAPSGISTGGLMDEILAKLRFAGIDSAAVKNVKDFGVSYFYENELLKFLLEDIVSKSEGDILLHTRVTDVLQKDNHLDGVIVETISGRAVVLAKAFVDCTGDPFLAEKMGLNIQTKQQQEQLPLTCPYLLENVDYPKLQAYLQTDSKLEKAIEKARQTHLPLSDQDILWNLIKGQREDSIIADTIQIYGLNPTLPFERSKAEYQARQRLFAQLEFYRLYIPGMEQCYLQRCSLGLIAHAIHQIGARKEEKISSAILNHKCREGIARSVGTGRQYAGQEKQEITVQMLTANASWFEIPLSCFIVSELDNLLVAGIGINLDSSLQECIGFGQQMTMGQAAGVTASMIAKGMKSSAIDGEMIQSILNELGCDIHGELSCSYSGAEDMEFPHARIKVLFGEAEELEESDE